MKNPTTEPKGTPSSACTYSSGPEKPRFMTGVKKELKFAVPVYLFFGAVSVMLLIVFKLTQWGVV